jgi:prepilin-type N-terminal cleavage/methylation domain-containing protein
MNLFHSKSLAFTLVELLVVIAIVGLLSTIVLAVTSGVSEQGRIAKGLQFSKHLENSLGDHLVGRWTFDETANLCGTDKVCDTSGWDNHGTINGEAFLIDSGTPSGQGKAMRFDGDGDYVDVGNDTSLAMGIGEFTVEAWIKTIIPANGIYIARNGSYQYLELYTLSGYLRLYTRNSDYNLVVDNTINISDGNWHHVVGTRNSEKLWLYIDGIMVKDAISTNLDVGTGSLGNYVRIGWTYDNPSPYFNGLIDEVAIYSTALTASQIQSQYYTGLNRLLNKGLIYEVEYQERIKN